MTDKIKCLMSQSELNFWGVWMTYGKEYLVVRTAENGTSVWVKNDLGEPEFLEYGDYCRIEE